MEILFNYGVTVTPNDNADIDSEIYYGLTCTTAGNAVLVTAANTTVTVSLAVGQMLRGMGFRRVKSTSTTAAGITAWR